MEFVLKRANNGLIDSNEELFRTIWVPEDDLTMDQFVETE